MGPSRNRTVDPGARVRHDTGMGRGARRGRGEQGGRRGCGCSLILLVVILVGLVAAAEVGLRWYLSDRAEKEVSAHLDAPVDISFGGGLLLWEVLTTRTAEKVHLTSPGSETVPQLDVTGRSVSLVDGAVHAAGGDGTAVRLEPLLGASIWQRFRLRYVPVCGMRGPEGAFPTGMVV